jgi:transposase-like protein
MTERASPFYCPYCGDEDLRPEEEENTAARSASVEGGGGRRAGAWLCSGCRRVFSVKFIGLSIPEVSK